MSVLAPPPQHDREALIREARARQRRRWLGAAVLLALLAGAALGIESILAAGGPHPKQGFGSRPLATPSISRCRTNQLAVAPAGGGLYTGHSVIDFAIRNVSGHVCSLRGLPRVDLVMRDGRRVAAREQRVWNRTRRSDKIVPVRTVLLPPHSVASFLVIVVNQVGRRGPEPQVFCSWSRAILLAPPGGTGPPLRVRYSLSNCGLGVTPLHAGGPRRYSFG